MDISKFASRKLIATTLCVAMVAIASIIGAPLDEASLATVQNMLLGLLGAQGAVDTAAAWKAGQAIAGSVKAVQELQPSSEPTEDA